MAFDPDFLFEAATIKSGSFFEYFSTTDDLLTIRGSGYFNAATNLTIGKNGLINGTDGEQEIVITGVSPTTVELKTTIVTLNRAANPAPAGTEDFEICFMGQCATLLIPEVTLTGNSNPGLFVYSGLPQLYWPKVNHEIPGFAIQDNGTFTEVGALVFDTSGNITIGATNAMSTAYVEPANFASTATDVGHQGYYLTYMVA